MLRKYTQLKQFVIVASLAALMIACSKEEVVEEEKADPAISEFIEEINADSLRNYIQWMENMGTRFALSPDRKQVATNIRNKFIEFGYANAELDSFYRTVSYRGLSYPYWHYNVIATLPGIVYPDSVCIIGGHYDNIIQTGDPFDGVPGANDNASGISVTLEVARVLKKQNFTPTTTIKFLAFGAEELGLYGSRDYAYKAKAAGMQIKMMLNNDMVGYWPSNMPNPVINVIDYPDSYDLRLNAEKSFRLYTGLTTVNDNTYQAYSDSYSFYLYGFKAVFFISSADDNTYHTINDLTININPEFCREVAKVNCVLLIQNNGN